MRGGQRIKRDCRTGRDTHALCDHTLTPRAVKFIGDFGGSLSLPFECAILFWKYFLSFSILLKTCNIALLLYPRE